MPRGRFAFDWLAVVLWPGGLGQSAGVGGESALQELLGGSLRLRKVNPLTVLGALTSGQLQLRALAGWRPGLRLFLISWLGQNPLGDRVQTLIALHGRLLGLFLGRLLLELLGQVLSSLAQLPEKLEIFRTERVLLKSPQLGHELTGLAVKGLSISAGAR